MSAFVCLWPEAVYAMNNLVALDTSTEYLSLTVAAGSVLRSHHAHVGQQHAEATLPTLHRLLAEQGLSAQALEAIAFGNGPGAFTGLRIGCGLAQGLALALDIPVIPVSTLAVLAASVPASQVLACLDARMGQVYYAGYVDGEEVLAPGLYTPDDVPLPPGEGWWLVGSGAAAHQQALQTRLGACLVGVDGQATPHAEALIGLARSGRWPACAPEAAELCYVRDKVALKTHERLNA
jgi:tRNA threonylcarbamoyladenosine biosynthesis protein TsaB